MIISVDDLQKYTGVKPDNPADLQIYVDSAIDMIKSYLGYDPIIEKRIEYIDGHGTNKIQLKHKPVNLVYSVTDYNTNEVLYEIQDLKEYIVTEEFVEFRNVVFPTNKLIVEYLSGYGFYDPFINFIDGGTASTMVWDSGYDCGNAESRVEVFYDGGDSNSLVIDTIIPSIIKQTALRISALLLTESKNNIGITSKSFGDSGSRTFTNFTNLDRYLTPLQHFRLVVI